jgi:hypothetical protein
MRGSARCTSYLALVALESPAPHKIETYSPLIG